MNKRLSFYLKLAMQMSNENWTWSEIEMWLKGSLLTDEEIAKVKTELNNQIKLASIV